MKKLITLLFAIAICGALPGNAQDFTPGSDTYTEYTGGYGYEEVRRSPYLAPTVALATVAIVAIVAVAVQNSSHSGHGHSHSN